MNPYFKAYVFSIGIITGMVLFKYKSEPVLVEPRTFGMVFKESI